MRQGAIRVGALSGGRIGAGKSTDPTLTLDDVIAQLGTLTGDPEFEKYGSFVEEITKKSTLLWRRHSRCSSASLSRRMPPCGPTRVYDLNALAGDPILQTLAR